jgi:hypothetical protein
MVGPDLNVRNQRVILFEIHFRVLPLCWKKLRLIRPPCFLFVYFPLLFVASHITFLCVCVCVCARIPLIFVIILFTWRLFVQTQQVSFLYTKLTIMGLQYVNLFLMTYALTVVACWCQLCSCVVTLIASIIPPPSARKRVPSQCTMHVHRCIGYEK